MNIINYYNHKKSKASYNNISPFMWIYIIMIDQNFKDIIALLSTILFKDCSPKNHITFKQVQHIMNVLITANIPFELTFSQGTRSTVQTIQIQVTLSPSTSLTKIFPLDEGQVTSDLE